MLTLGKVRNEKDPGDAGSGELGRSWRGETAPAGEPGDRERSVHHDKAMIVATRARKLSTSSTIALPLATGRIEFTCDTVLCGLRHLDKVNRSGQSGR